MERAFKPASSSKAVSRREFLAAGALAAGLLICGRAMAGDLIRDLAGELRAKFRQMEGYGIAPLVCWTDPTMRSLLGAMSQMNNAATAQGKSEPFAVSGGSHEEQFRSLNLWLGRSAGSPFDPSSLAALERRLP